MFTEQPEVKTHTKVKRGMIPRRLSEATAQAVEYFQMDSARIELAVSKEIVHFLAEHSGEAAENVKYQTFSVFKNTVLKNQKEIALKVEKLYPELKKAHVNQITCDLVARMYTSNNKLSWVNPQAKGKLNYQSVMRQVINKDGGMRIAHLLEWFHSNETKRTTPGSKRQIAAIAAKTFSWSTEPTNFALSPQADLEKVGTLIIIKELKERKAPQRLDFKQEPEFDLKVDLVKIKADAEKITQEKGLVGKELKLALVKDFEDAKKRAYEAQRKHRVAQIAKRGTEMSEFQYMKRAIEAYYDYLNGNPSGFIILKDFAASGIIWWSVIIKLPKLAKYANLLDNNDKEIYRDPYEAIAIDLIKHLGGTLTPELARSMRKAIKSTLQAILHGGAFGPAARDFSKLNLLGRDITEEEMTKAFVALFGANILLIRELTEFSQTLITERRPFNSWLSPDGTKCLNRFAGAKRKYKVWYANHENANGKAYITLTERTHFVIDPTTGKPAKSNTKTQDIYGNEVVEEAKLNGFAANFLHSIDAFVGRMIAKALEGRLYIFVHDNYGVHPNDVTIVEKTTRRAIALIARLNFLQRAVDGMIKEANEGFQKEANFEVREKALNAFKEKCLSNQVKFKIADFDESSYENQQCKVVGNWNLNLGTLFKELPLTEEFPYLQY